MRLLALLLAVAAPLLIAMPLPPIVTMGNQLLAILGWGVVMLVAPAPALERATLRAAAPLLAVFAMAVIGCVASIQMGGLPSPPGNGQVGVLLLAAAVALHGTAAGGAEPIGFLRPFAITLLVAGVVGALTAVLQIFAPHLLPEKIVVLPNLPGRASGNIGQSNHLADYLLWGLIAIVPLARAWRADAPRTGVTRAARAGWAAAALLMIFGLVLSGSRMAVIALLMMALWGALDRRLSGPVRIALVGSPVVWGLLLWITGWWIAHYTSLGPSLTDRGNAGITAYRADIWRAALMLIREQPWLGVGWGQFNFAWSLTPLSIDARAGGLMDNTHDLPLQLAVELGVPAALVMMGLLLGALGWAFARVRRLPGEAGIGARAMLLIVLAMGAHSMFEYPMWYSYLLLPTAWAFGLALGVAAAAHQPAVAAPPLRAWRALGLMMTVLAASACLDYLNIVGLFKPHAGAAPLEDRIRSAQLSPLFSNQGDFVAIMEHKATVQELPLIQRSARIVVNSRLLYLWSNLLQEQGQTDKARFLAARMREFNLVGARDWFNVCSDPAVAAKPFQCLPPEHPVSWRDFR